jgi:hypothetical protein
LTVADLEWGMKIARRSVASLMQAVKERVADNEYESLVKRVHRIIANAGAAGIDGTALSRDTQFVDRRKRADILAQLAESAMIRIETREKAEGARGPSTQVYYDIS